MVLLTKIGQERGKIMQNNNNFRVFSGDTTNILSDSELSSDVVTKGAVKNTVADSALYNTLSKATSTVTTAVADFVASQNPDTTFGMDTSVSTMITATNNAIVGKNNFNSSNPTQFGNYIISKKILVWDNTENSTSVTLDPRNKKLQVISQARNLQDVILRVSPGSLTASEYYLCGFIPNAPTGGKLYYLKMSYQSPNSLSFQYYYMDTTDGSMHTVGTKVQKIYEIIE